MSKAEEKSLKEYPQNIVTDYNGSHDLNYYKRVLYQQGYHQAEKDLELTWKDIMKIETLCFKVDIRCDLEARYQEILKRFKEIKK